MFSQITFASALIMSANATRQYNQYGASEGIASLLRPGHQDAQVYQPYESHAPAQYGNDHQDYGYGDDHQSFDYGYGNQHNDQSYGNDHNDLSYGNDHNDLSYGNDHNDQSYGNDHQDYGYGNAHQGYGSSNNQSYGSPWVRRSTMRPRDVKAFNTEPVDNYWSSKEPEYETIRASCEFDFLGYSYSSGSVELVQEPHDLTSIIGEFEGLHPGVHGLKIHEFGDLEYGCESAGEVFNPFGSYQGHSHEDIHDRRVGDIEQIQARFDSNAEYKNRDMLVNLSGPNSVIGRSMVVYEREDDHDQTEHAQTADREGRWIEGKGRRIACCTIGLAKAEKVTHSGPPRPIHPASQEDQLVFTSDPNFRQHNK